MCFSVEAKGRDIRMGTEGDHAAASRGPSAAPGGQPKPRAKVLSVAHEQRAA